jgi:PBP1b-binding outer membrane lipoprotein LpoB
LEHLKEILIMKVSFISLAVVIGLIGCDSASKPAADASSAEAPNTTAAPVASTSAVAAPVESAATAAPVEAAPVAAPSAVPSASAAVKK